MNTNLNIVTENVINRDIIFIFYNDFYKKREKYKHDYAYAEQLMFLTFSNTNNSFEQNINFIQGYNLEELLKLAKFHNFKKAIIQTPGHVLKNKFITEFKKFIENKHWLFIGHILEKNDYIFLHDQCIVVNIEKLELDELDMGIESDEKLMPDYTRSTDNFHDDYLPTWVQFNEKYKKTKVKPSWKWISKGLLDNGLFAFPNELRNAKIHLYPENYKHYETWYNSTDENTQMRKILNEFKNGAKNRQLHFYNNEPCLVNKISNISNKTTFDTIIVPASGFYGLKMFSYFKPKNIIYYDVMPEMLKLRKDIDENWNGIDSLETFIDRDIFDNSKRKNFSLFNDNVIDKNVDLPSLLNEYKKTNIKYCCLDVCSDIQEFIDIVPKDGTVYIWTNSIYTYWNNIWTHLPHQILENYYKLQNNLQSFDNELWLHVKEPSGKEKIYEVHNRYNDIIFASGYKTWS